MHNTRLTSLNLNLRNSLSPSLKASRHSASFLNLTETDYFYLVSFSLVALLFSTTHSIIHSLLSILLFVTLCFTAAASRHVPFLTAVAKAVEEELMKRRSEALSSRSTLEKKKACLQNIIKSLIAPESHGLSNQQAQILPMKLSREEDFLRRVHGIHYLLRGNKRKIFEVQSNRIEARQIKGYVETLAKEVQDQGQQIGTIEKQVQELKQQLSQCRHRPVCNDPGNTTMPFLERELEGDQFEENAEIIMGWLKDSQASKIGVWGVGGVGKTALVTYVFKLLLQASGICQPFWVPMSQCENVYKVQGSIVKCIGLDLLDKEDEKIRAIQLFRKLANMGNIVLILDDMREPFLAHKVGIPLGENGCKITLTTRSLEVCQIMGCGEFVIKV